MGRVDYGESDDLIPREPGIKVLGASSDHTILDVEGATRRLKTGDVLEFDLCYATIDVYKRQGYSPAGRLRG